MKKWLLVLCLLLTACGGGSYDAPVPAAPSPVVWEDRGVINGTVGNYLSLLIEPDPTIRVFSNFNGSDNTNEAKLYQKTGTFAAISNTSVVLDLPGQYLRTFGIARGESGTCYALLRVGTAYGQSSYYPWLAVSDSSCGNWKVVASKLWLGNSNSNTLIVNESAPAVLDTRTPTNNKFLVYDDSVGVKLALMYSNGSEWRAYTDGSGKPVELLPAAVSNVNAQFASSVKTPFGYHVIVANWSDSQGAAIQHVHLFSCDGLKWGVLETQSPTYSGPKGTTLTYEAGTGYVHSVSTGGKHLAFRAKNFGCTI